MELFTPVKNLVSKESQIRHPRLLWVFAVFVVAAVWFDAHAQEEEKNPLTHGNVQMNLTVGVTTQLEVVETFGAPNITTIDGSGREVWSYHRHASVAKSKTKEGYWTLVLFGESTTKSGFEKSSRSMLLIIKFNEQKIVSDFKSRVSSF